MFALSLNSLHHIRKVWGVDRIAQAERDGILVGFVFEPHRRTYSFQFYCVTCEAFWWQAIEEELLTAAAFPDNITSYFYTHVLNQCPHATERWPAGSEIVVKLGPVDDRKTSLSRVLNHIVRSLGSDSQKEKPASAGS